MEIKFTWGIIIAIIAGIIAAVKEAGVNPKFLSLFAIGSGLIFSFVAYFAGQIDLMSCILGGFISGLAAVGLMNGTPDVIAGTKAYFVARKVAKAEKSV